MWERFWSKKMSWEFFYYVAKPFEGKKMKYSELRKNGHQRNKTLNDHLRINDGERKMAYEKIEVEMKEAKNFEKGTVVEGIYKAKKEHVGKNDSNIYTIGEDEYWGSGALDVLMSKVGIGQKVKITCTADDVQYKKGKGKAFDVEVEK